MIKRINVCVAYAMGIVSMLFFLVSACSRSHGPSNPDIVRAHALADKNSSETFVILAGIDRKSLSEHDRHLYDLISIKARDKSYIKHVSDSTILDALAYFSRQDDKGLYAEALYYAGRVYCDLGDFPSACKFFEQLIDTLPNEKKYQPLRSSVLSQYGGLLSDLRLYRKAIPYILQSIELDSIGGDTSNEVLDLNLIGNAYMEIKNDSAAEHSFRKALYKSQNLPATYAAKSSMHLAILKYRIGDNDSALYYIRGIPDKVKPVSRNDALAAAARIYLRQGIADTAYMYAKALVESDESYNKQFGYHILLAPELRGYVHPDSIFSYIYVYRRIIESLYDANESQLAMIQHSAYDYSIHERERLKAEESNIKLYFYVGVLTIVVLLLLMLVVVLRYHHDKIKSNLKIALRDIAVLRQSLAALETDSSCDEREVDGTDIRVEVPDIYPRNESAGQLKDKLRESLIRLHNDSKPVKDTPEVILKSNAYSKLQEHIAKNKSVGDSDQLWDELEEVVLSCSPRFKENLQLLTSGKLKPAELHTALLIKCGFRPSEMMVLFGRTKGTISSRRESLCIRMIGEQMGSKALDSIIRHL